MEFFIGVGWFSISLSVSRVVIYRTRVGGRL